MTQDQISQIASHLETAAQKLRQTAPATSGMISSPPAPANVAGWLQLVETLLPLIQQILAVIAPHA